MCYLHHVCVQSLSRVQLSATPRTVARQAPLSMGLSRQEYWSGVPFPSPGDLPDVETESASPTLASGFLNIELPRKPSFRLLTSIPAPACAILNIVRCLRSDQISRSVVSDSLRPHESQHTRPPRPSPTPGVHSNSEHSPYT